MTGATLAAGIRRRMGGASTDSLSDATLLPIVNEAKDEIAALIVKKNPQLFLIPTLFDLVASSTSNHLAREYPLPDDMLARLVTLECEFDSSNSPFEYIPLKPYPGGMERLVDDIGGITEANIIANFSNDDPNQCSTSGLGCGAYYVKTRNGVYILSGTISAVTNGGRARVRQYPSDLANLSGSTGLHIDPSTTTFGVPLAFHNLWADLVAIKLKTERPNPLPLSEYDKGYPSRLAEQLDLISIDDTREEMFGTLTNRGNNGFDY